MCVCVYARMKSRICTNKSVDRQNGGVGFRNALDKKGGDKSLSKKPL